ncbi:lactonase, 7-bladed beta-propeller [Ceratobasidium sp. AG-Ba]|nr:lactonase, 7-bladed beta-propeller [Ceratobasidium sp. AG-Ba]
MVAAKTFTLLVGAYGSAITGVRFDPSSPNLTVLGTSDSGHSGLAKTRQVAVMDYSSGTGAFIPLGDDLLTLDEANAQKITFNATVSHPHQAVEVGDEVIVPDLGADKIWRLTQSPNAQGAVPNWEIRGFVEQPTGSGPRHIAVDNGVLYTLHELASTLSSQTLPPLAYGAPSETISSFSILPPGANGSTFGAAELIIDTKRSLLYASNRNLAASPDPRGDTIAIFSYNATGHLTPVDQFFTGLNQIRAMAHGGPDNQYIAAAGLTGGGLAVFEKTGNSLTERARLPAGSIDKPASFVWL